jgi:hypothetical protein
MGPPCDGKTKKTAIAARMSKTPVVWRTYRELLFEGVSWPNRWRAARMMRSGFMPGWLGGVGRVDGLNQERTRRRCRFQTLRGTSSRCRFVSLSAPLRLSSLMIFLARSWYSGQKLRTTIREYSLRSSTVDVVVSPSSMGAAPSRKQTTNRGRRRGLDASEWRPEPMPSFRPRVR